MIGQQTECWRRADCGEGVLEMIATQLPDRFDVQRLGSLSNPRLELAGDAHQHLAGLVGEFELDRFNVMNGGVDGGFQDVFLVWACAGLA